MIDVRAISRRFGSFSALDQVSLQVEKGELVALLGPSGSGKTTLLRIIAGLEVADQGQIMIEGRDSTTLPPRDRRMGFVFQHFALFRHMTVRENVAFGLKVRDRSWRPHRDEINDRVNHLLKMVQLDGMAHRYPSQLSGGQRQRVALARALAIEPRVLLLDEPFGALDARVRKELRRWLRHLHDELGMTGILVTHDQEEALEVADRVVVMNRGKIEQVGTPAEICDHPATPFVCHFLGNVNSLSCTVQGGHVHLDNSPLRMVLDDRSHGGASEATAFVRPHDITILPLPAGPAGGEDFTAPADLAADGSSCVVATVRHAVILGGSVRAELELAGGETIEADIPRHALGGAGGAAIDMSRGSRVLVRLQRAEVFLSDGRKFPALAPGRSHLPHVVAAGGVATGSDDLRRT